MAVQDAGAAVRDDEKCRDEEKGVTVTVSLEWSRPEKPSGERAIAGVGGGSGGLASAVRLRYEPPSVRQPSQGQPQKGPGL